MPPKRKADEDLDGGRNKKHIPSPADPRPRIGLNVPTASRPSTGFNAHSNAARAAAASRTSKALNAAEVARTLKEFNSVLSSKQADETFLQMVERELPHVPPEHQRMAAKWLPAQLAKNDREIKALKRIIKGMQDKNSNYAVLPEHIQRVAVMGIEHHARENPQQTVEMLEKEITRIVAEAAVALPDDQLADRIETRRQGKVDAHKKIKALIKRVDGSQSSAKSHRAVFSELLKSMRDSIDRSPEEIIKNLTGILEDAMDDEDKQAEENVTAPQPPAATKSTATQQRDATDGQQDQDHNQEQNGLVEDADNRQRRLKSKTQGKRSVDDKKLKIVKNVQLKKNGYDVKDDFINDDESLESASEISESDRENSQKSETPRPRRKNILKRPRPKPDDDKSDDAPLATPPASKAIGKRKRDVEPLATPPPSKAIGKRKRDINDDQSDTVVDKAMAADSDNKREDDKKQQPPQKKTKALNEADANRILNPSSDAPRNKPAADAGHKGAPKGSLNPASHLMRTRAPNIRRVPRPSQPSVNPRRPGNAAHGQGTAVNRSGPSAPGPAPGPSRPRDR